MSTELMRKRMITAYREVRKPDLFLAGFFKTPARNIFAGEKVSIDIKRGTESISPVVSVMTGPTMNATDIFTTKEFTPPSFEEGAPFNCFDLLKRTFGVDEYQSTEAVNWFAAMMTRVIEALGDLEDKINRTIEVQASQVLQTGLLTLKDKTGTAAYTIDFKPKATHFPTAADPWDTTSDKLGDLEALADVIRDDSMQDADTLIMGDDAFSLFIRDTEVQKFFNKLVLNIAALAPVQPIAGVGGKFQGQVHIGNYRFNIWTYGGRYLDIGASTKTKFVLGSNVIMLSSGARLDKVFGGVPRAVPVDPRFAGILPDRISIPMATDFSPNIYTTVDGKQVICEVASRPLCIPTAIDSFGCLDIDI